jgi:hypothetical protein
MNFMTLQGLFYKLSDNIRSSYFVDKPMVLAVQLFYNKQPYFNAPTHA